MERALATGLPLAIEQDLYLDRDPASGEPRAVVAHDRPEPGTAPGLREHFFERIRPYMEKALSDNRRDQWPLIVLNLDFKTVEPALHSAVWKLLVEYEQWISSAPRTATEAKQEPLEVRPLLVLAGNAEEHERYFHDEVPVGGRLRVFGAARVVSGSRWDTPPEWMTPEPADNYRRWWNNSWYAVEEGGQKRAGEWTAADKQRLVAMVKHAHDNGYMIRFYTLNGYTEAETTEHGTGKGYNFPSLEAAKVRWQAAIEAGVDFLATDMYEEFGATLGSTHR